MSFAGGVVCVWRYALETDGWFDEGKQVILSTLPIPCAVTAIDNPQTCDLSAVGLCILKEKIFCQTA